MAYGLYDGSLESLPGLGGYLQQQKLNRQADASTLQQATGAMGILDHLRAQQQDAQLRDALSKSGGDLTKAYQAAIQTGNLAGAAKLAPLLKLQQDQEIAKTLTGQGSAATADQWEALGQKLGALGHSGATQAMATAERMRKKEADTAAVTQMRETPQGLAGGQAVPGSAQVMEPGASVPPEDMAAFLKVAQSKGPATAEPQPGDTSPVMGSGALSALAESKAPAIAARARYLQNQINNPAFKGDLPMLQRDIVNLTRMEQAFQTNAAKPSAEPLEKVMGPNGAVLTPRSQAVGMTPAPTSGASTSKYTNVQQDGQGGWVGLNKDTGQMEKVPSVEGATSSQGSIGARESVFINRVVLSGNEAARDLENVTKLPMAASTGFFGGRGQPQGIFNAGKETLANKMTSQEVQSYNVMATGFQRSLSAIEAAGLAPSGALSHQMDTVLFREGDTNLTKLQKLAQTRQIIEAGLESMMTNPRIPKETKDHAQAIIDKVSKAVPFTQADLISLQEKQQVNPNTTLKDVIGKVKSGKPSAADFFK